MAERPLIKSPSFIHDDIGANEENPNAAGGMLLENMSESQYDTLTERNRLNQYYLTRKAQHYRFKKIQAERIKEMRLP